MKKHSSRYKHTGISLVELLVAMAVGIMLLAGIIQVYLSNYTATKMITGFSAQLENSRVAIGSVTRSLRSAGHYGGVDGNDIGAIGAVNISGIGSCNHAWVTNVRQPIFGYEGASAIGGVTNFPANCIPSGEYVANTDILAVRYGAASGLAPIGGLSSAKVYLRTAISQGINGGEILLGSDSGLTSLGAGVDGVGIYNYEYKMEMYYVRPCSEADCGGCDDGMPSLVRLRLDGEVLTAETLAEGVEQFQVEYGIDSNSDYVVDSYADANGVADWNQVMSARFGLVVRGDNKDSAYTDEQTYVLPGGYVYQPDTEVTSYRRKAYSKVVQLRNMNRG